VTLSGNRLVVDSTNFQLDENGNATFSGDVTGATITGGTVTGTTLSGGTITGSEISVGVLEADEEEFSIGSFYMSNSEYGRGVFQSRDEVTGMSCDTNNTRKLYFWAGYGRSASSKEEAMLLVNGGQVRVGGSLIVCGTNVMDEISSLWDAINSIDTGTEETE